MICSNSESGNIISRTDGRFDVVVIVAHTKEIGENTSPVLGYVQDTQYINFRTGKTD